MYIYLISIFSLYLLTYASRRVRLYLSGILILAQLEIMGRVGGDNDSYIERGLYALDDPDF